MKIRTLKLFSLVRALLNDMSGNFRAQRAHRSKLKIDLNEIETHQFQHFANSNVKIGHMTRL